MSEMRTAEQLLVARYLELEEELERERASREELERELADAEGRGEEAARIGAPVEVVRADVMRAVDMRSRVCPLELTAEQVSDVLLSDDVLGAASARSDACIRPLWVVKREAYPLSIEIAGATFGLTCFTCSSGYASLSSALVMPSGPEAVVGRWYRKDMESRVRDAARSALERELREHLAWLEDGDGGRWWL